jgi:hypothetical protein
MDSGVARLARRKRWVLLTNIEEETHEESYQLVQPGQQNDTGLTRASSSTTHEVGDGGATIGAVMARKAAVALAWGNSPYAH